MKEPKRYNFEDAKYPERMRGLREDNDLTQEYVAEILGVAQSTYSQYEARKRAMPIEFIMTLCKLYGVSADYLIGLSDKRR